MITYYFNGSPNPLKVTLFLEETGLPYEPAPIDIRRGQQFSPEFLAINPNGKVPAIVDEGKAVFDSGAILLYLAEKTGAFLPPASLRHETLSWLMFVASGVGPFSGQAVHFKTYAPETIPYAHERYQYEAARHYGILDERLKGRPFIVGDAYSIIDMAVWGWARLVPFILGDDAWARFPNLKRLVDAVGDRPAAARALALRDRFAFKTETDADARGHMFRHQAKAGAA